MGMVEQIQNLSMPVQNNYNDKSLVEALDYYHHLVKNNIIVNTNLYDMVKYLDIKDYIFVYVICFVMSILISFRYSRKLFNSSAMKTYREEAE